LAYMKAMSIRSEVMSAYIAELSAYMKAL